MQQAQVIARKNTPQAGNTLAPAAKQGTRVAHVLRTGFTHKLFPPHLQLIPQMHELYEMELASAEAALMPDEDLVRNAGYFAKVSNEWTRHFLICSGEPLRLPKHSSSQLRSFFQSNQFRTGYATHGLFPYRGKFHPQMIKGLLNAMGLKRGERVIDPMMGSGTVLIEAKLMGINSLGLDTSPFCRFMVQAKLDGLSLPLPPVQAACRESKAVFDHFKKRAGQPTAGSKARYTMRPEPMDGALMDAGGQLIYDSSFGALPHGCQAPAVYGFLLLAYLDAAGYSERSERKSPFDQFHAILERYYFVIEKIQNVLSGFESDLADAMPRCGDARQIPLEQASVDGVLFSPPYSFAIDYLDNDSFHLKYLGADAQSLRADMIGLRGATLTEKFELYRKDMDTVMSECARVLRPGRFCTVVVGTNNNQLAKILRTTPDKVAGIDQLISVCAKTHGLHEIRKLQRQIRGMSNTMRTEHIVFLQKL